MCSPSAFFHVVPADKRPACATRGVPLSSTLAAATYLPFRFRALSFFHRKHHKVQTINQYESRDKPGVCLRHQNKADKPPASSRHLSSQPVYSKDPDINYRAIFGRPDSRLNHGQDIGRVTSVPSGFEAPRKLHECKYMGQFKTAPTNECHPTNNFLISSSQNAPVMPEFSRSNWH